MRFVAVEVFKNENVAFCVIIKNFCNNVDENGWNWLDTVLQYVHQYKEGQSMFLVGNFQHTLDDKNRIRLPADFRKDMGSNYYLMPGTNGCIFVYKAEESQNIISKLYSLDTLNSQKTLDLIQITAFSRSVTADGQGRFGLPDDLIKIMGIKKDVRIVGAGTKVVIWSEEKWQELLGDIDNLKPDRFNAVYDSLDAALMESKWFSNINLCYLMSA